MSEAKIRASQKALDFILPKITKQTVLGIGTGSTVNCFIELLAIHKYSFKGIVSSSKVSSDLIAKHGIEEFELNDVNSVSFYIDGADEVSKEKNLIKGGGGAHTREKIVAAASESFICIADQSKFVDQLGKFPLPIEVAKVARSYVSRCIVGMGGLPEFRQNFITDLGNQIIDVRQLNISNPRELEIDINAIPGVIDNGIFSINKPNKIFSN